MTMWTLGTLTLLVALFVYPTSTQGPVKASASLSPSPSPQPTPRTYVGDKVKVKGNAVQVRITLTGSKLTAVSVPVYPVHNRRASRAVPVLVKETLAAQSAKVAAVKGSPLVSKAYVGSLKSALKRAGKSTGRASK